MVKEGKVTFKTDISGSVILEDKVLSGAMSVYSLLRYLAMKAGIKFPNIFNSDKKLIFEVTIREERKGG